MITSLRVTVLKEAGGQVLPVRRNFASFESEAFGGSDDHHDGGHYLRTRHLNGIYAR
jgi:hypothetical protein